MGRRALVERLWPRGCAENRLISIAGQRTGAPADELLSLVRSMFRTVAEFKRRYRAELIQHPGNWESLVELARSEPVTLLFSAG